MSAANRRSPNGAPAAPSSANPTSPAATSKQPERKPPANARTVWEIDSAIEDNPGSVHPTMKPLELIRRPITYHTKPGDLIYEPFSGSGTCLVAAEETGRRCCALELSPAFVDVAVIRWQNFTGKQATLDDDGRTFDEVAAERCE